MSKIIIDKQVILDRIAELKVWVEKYNIIDTTHQKEDFINELQSILQQSEEYNENEAVEFADWIANNYYGRTSMGIWRSDNLGFNTQELFKQYKNERETN